MNRWSQGVTSVRDRAYCRRCIYASPVMLREDYLCDYLAIVGRPRGCKAGDGCTERRIPGKKTRKKKTP